MNKPVLQQTPVYAASHIDAVLHEVRVGKMLEDDYGDAIPIKPSLRRRLLTDGEEFKQAIDAADKVSGTIIAQRHDLVRRIDALVWLCARGGS